MVAALGSDHIDNCDCVDPAAAGGRHRYLHCDHMHLSEAPTTR